MQGGGLRWGEERIHLSSPLSPVRAPTTEEDKKAAEKKREDKAKKKHDRKSKRLDEEEEDNEGGEWERVRGGVPLVKVSEGEGFGVKETDLGRCTGSTWLEWEGA